MVNKVKEIIIYKTEVAVIINSVKEHKNTAVNSTQEDHILIN